MAGSGGTQSVVIHAMLGELPKGLLLKVVGSVGSLERVGQGEEEALAKVRQEVDGAASGPLAIAGPRGELSADGGVERVYEGAEVLDHIEKV